MMLYGLVVLLSLILLASLTWEEGFQSFGDYYARRDKMYEDIDAANAAFGARKEVGPNVTDLTHGGNIKRDRRYDDDDDDRYTTRDDQRYDDRRRCDDRRYDEYWYTTGDRSLYDTTDRNRYNTTDRRSVYDDRRSTSGRSDCETLHIFTTRETAVTGSMLSHFTAEQKLQLQTFMNLLNKYVELLQRTRPDVIPNLISNRRDTLLATVLLFAQKDNNDLARALLTSHAPILQTPTMSTYIDAFLLASDMKDITDKKCRL